MYLVKTFFFQMADSLNVNPDIACHVHSWDYYLLFLTSDIYVTKGKCGKTT